MNDQDFNLFWLNYPRHTGKKPAMAKFLKLEKTLLPEILKAVEEQKKSSQWQDPKYIPHPETWINQARWEDEKTIVGDPVEAEIREWLKEGTDMALSRFMTKYEKTPEYDKLYFKHEKLLGQFHY